MNFFKHLVFILLLKRLILYFSSASRCEKLIDLGLWRPFSQNSDFWWMVTWLTLQSNNFCYN